MILDSTKKIYKFVTFFPSSYQLWKALSTFQKLALEKFGSPGPPRRRTRGTATKPCFIQTGKREELRLERVYSKLLSTLELTGQLRHSQFSYRQYILVLLVKDYKYMLDCNAETVLLYPVLSSSVFPIRSLSLGCAHLSSPCNTKNKENILGVH